MRPVKNAVTITTEVVDLNKRNNIELGFIATADMLNVFAELMVACGHVPPKNITTAFEMMAGRINDRKVKHTILGNVDGVLTAYIFSADQHVQAYHVMGKYYGYPDCCIEAFLRGDHHLEEEIVAYGTGYVPCKTCASTKTEEQLASEINNHRMCTIKYPNGNIFTDHWLNHFKYYMFDYTVPESLPTRSKEAAQRLGRKVLQRVGKQYGLS